MIPTVNLDDRTFDDIKDEAIRLIPRYCPEWTNHNASDPGITLIELFSWMTEMTLYRLNKVPSKNYLSMLELMGLSLTAPQSARSVIRFFPVDNCRKNILVKSSTKIASLVNEAEPIIFETEKNLIVRDTKLVSCISRYGESWKKINTDVDSFEQFTLFETQNNVEHALYIKSDVFKYLSEGHSVQIAFDSVAEILSVNDEIVNHVFFEYWNGSSWQEVESHGSIRGIKRSDNVVYIKGPVDVQSCEINGDEGIYIRAVLTDIPENGNSIKVKSLKVRSIFEGDGFIPDLCIANSNGAYDTIDMNSSFRLFSENPGFNEIFYIASDEILRNAGSKVMLHFTFSEVYVPEAENDNALFAYEYWNGKDWIKLNSENDDFIDGTFGFKQAGTVSFNIPEDLKPVNVLNEEHLYVRIRLITRDFSVGGTYVLDDKGSYQWEFNSKVQSPLLNKIRISYNAPMQKPEKVISNTNFKWIELNALCEPSSDNVEIELFNIEKEQLPTLYLGFNNKISEGDFGIYFKLDENAIVKKSAKVDLDFLSIADSKKNRSKRLVSIEWQYWNGAEWIALDYTDMTDSFHESGFITMNIPADLSECDIFGNSNYWIRAVKLTGSFEKLPVIKNVVTNAVYAVNADSYRNEIVGSGTGAPGQLAKVAHANLLPGLKLVVNEGSIPSDNEIRMMKRDGIENPFYEDEKGIWVTYREVQNFYNSDSFSRHFVIDYSTGQIMFGDGVHGINPPKGKFNIKVLEYKVGGGEVGNIAAHKLQMLTQSIPYISGCDNPFPAEGGSDMESVENLKSRSAGVFKSLNRAVTCEDFEWLSREASASVGRAFCLKEKTKDGKIKTIIVPEMSAGMNFSSKLEPSRELIRRVRDYLNERKLVGTQIQVSGPVYRDFSLKIELIFKSNVFDFEHEKLKIKEQLLNYFHSLTGDDGKGWQFGKDVTAGLILKTLEKNQTILSINKIELFDIEAGITVESLLIKEDELPYLSDLVIVERRM